MSSLGSTPLSGQSYRLPQLQDGDLVEGDDSSLPQIYIIQDPITGVAMVYNVPSTLNFAYNILTGSVIVESPESNRANNFYFTRSIAHMYENQP